MNDNLFNLILQTATYNGEDCYNNAEEMENDYKVNQFLSLDPTEIKRLVFTAYQFGKNGMEIKENNESYARTLQTIQLNKAKEIISNLYAICKDNHYPNTSVLMEQAEQFLKECE